MKSINSVRKGWSLGKIGGSGHCDISGAGAKSIWQGESEVGGCGGTFLGVPLRSSGADLLPGVLVAILVNV